MSSRTRTLYAVLALLVAGLAFHAPAWNRSWHPTWDSAVYLSLARNLANGEGYVYNAAPHLKYPPGLPMLLAPFAGEPGADVGAERALMIACALAWMLLLYGGLRRDHGDAVAFATALAAGLSYAVLYHTVRVLSDVPFLVPWTLALFAGDRMLREPTRANAILFALLAMAAFAFRVVAVALLPAALLLLILRLRAHHSHRWRNVAVLALGLPVLAIGGWFAHTSAQRAQISEDLRDERTYGHELATGESYVADAPGVGLGGALRIAWGNLDYLRGLIGEAATAYAFPATTRDQLETAQDEIGWWYGLALCALTALALWGLHRTRPFLVLATLAYLALIVVWPSRQGVRFLLPAFPALYLAWTSGLGAIAASFRFPRAIGAATAAAWLLFVHAVAAVPNLGRAAGERRDWAQIYAVEHEQSYDTLARQLADEGARSLREREPTARLAADQAAYLVWRTGIDASSFPVVDRSRPKAQRGRELYAQLEERGITHVSLVPEGELAWPDLVEPLLALVGPAEFAARQPRAASALQALAANQAPAGGGADLIVPLSAFAR